MSSTRTQMLSTNEIATHARWAAPSNPSIVADDVLKRIEQVAQRADPGLARYRRSHRRGLSAKKRSIQVYLNQHEHMQYLETVFLYTVVCEKLQNDSIAQRFDGRQANRNRETFLKAIENLRAACIKRLHRADFDVHSMLVQFWKQMHAVIQETIESGTVKNETPPPTSHDDLIVPQVTVIRGGRSEQALP